MKQLSFGPKWKSKETSYGKGYGIQGVLDRDLFCLNERQVCRLTQIQSFALVRRLAAFFVSFLYTFE